MPSRMTRPIRAGGRIWIKYWPMAVPYDSAASMIGIHSVGGLGKNGKNDGAQLIAFDSPSMSFDMVSMSLTTASVP
jgi:hypothetical protein